MDFFDSNVKPTVGTLFRQDLIARLRYLEDPVPWVGLTAITWAGTFSPTLADEFALSGHAELSRRLSREELHAFCARADVPIAFRAAAVMAYGRSNSRNTRNNQNLWASIGSITPLLEALPMLTGKEAFAKFRYLIATGALRGMRASFFTKLMFFFGCRGAYILDQWMAKAVLALCAANWHVGTDGKLVFVLQRGNFVRLGYGGTSIHLDMSEGDYEQYCLALESLVTPLGRINGGDVERLLFSAPGSEWRRFLKTLKWKPKPKSLQPVE